MHPDHWLERLLSSRLFGVEEVHGIRRRQQSGERLSALRPKRGRDGESVGDCVVVICMPNVICYTSFLL